MIIAILVLLAIDLTLFLVTAYVIRDNYQMLLKRIANLEAEIDHLRNHARTTLNYDLDQEEIRLSISSALDKKWESYALLEKRIEEVEKRLGNLPSHEANKKAKHKKSPKKKK